MTLHLVRNVSRLCSPEKSSDTAKIIVAEYPMPVTVTTLFSIFAILEKKDAERSGKATGLEGHTQLKMTHLILSVLGVSVINLGVICL